MAKNQLLCKKDLALELAVSRDFVTMMCNAGFEMPGGKSTVTWALAWLKANPKFKPTRPRAKKEESLP